MYFSYRTRALRRWWKAPLTNLLFFTLQQRQLTVWRQRKKILSLQSFEVFFSFFGERIILTLGSVSLFPLTPFLPPFLSVCPTVFLSRLFFLLTAVTHSTQWTRTTTKEPTTSPQSRSTETGRRSLSTRWALALRPMGGWRWRGRTTPWMGWVRSETSASPTWKQACWFRGSKLTVQNTHLSSFCHLALLFHHHT